MTIEYHRSGKHLEPGDLRDALFALCVIPPTLLLRYTTDVVTASARVAAGVLDATPLKDPVVRLEESWTHRVATADAQAGKALVGVMSWVLDRIDLNGVVAERVDLDAIVNRVDVEAIINRVDLVAIADRVVSELDLPEIVRDSSQTMAAETVDGLRLHGMNADRTLSEFIDKVLRRKQGRGPGLGPSADPAT